MNRRQAHTTRHVPTGRDEAPEVPCQGEWGVFDTLIDGTADERRYAVRALADLCGPCPVRDACYRDNRDEPWARAVRGKKRAPSTKPQPSRGYISDEGRKRIGANNAAHFAEFNAARLEAINHMVAAGVGLPEILRRLAVRRDVLRVWCRRNGHDELWDTLAPRKTAVVSRPRRKREAA